MSMMHLAIAIIAIALIFDFINGFHDAANSVATIVATRVLTPFQAVLWAAFFNFVSAFTFGTGVAKTVGSGFVDVTLITPYVIMAGLMGAIAWDLITWWLGLPTSSSHALIGGYAGAAMANVAYKMGPGHAFHALIVGQWPATLMFIVLAPILGLVLAYILMIAVYWLFRRSSPHRMDFYFRKLQLVSAALYSFAHGTNDAQKTMGIITGGLTRLKPRGAFCAETSAAISILIATFLRQPVSTTHVIAGSIAGVGSIQRVRAVRWGLMQDIVWAWILTIPASAAIAGVAFSAIHLFQSF
jgi:PiT family inorganic phosphate transporter